MPAIITQDSYLSAKVWGPKFEVSTHVLQIRSHVFAVWDLVQVHLHQQIGIDINYAEVEDFAIKPYVIHPGSAELPLQWFECQPVVSERLAIMIVRIRNESCVTVTWAGDVWVYRGLLRAAGVTSLLLFM